MVDEPDFPYLCAAIFDDVGAFRGVLRSLLGAGFDAADVSILAPHDALADHFDDRIPSPDQLADLPDTPREDLAPETAVEAAARAIAEGLSAIGAIGAAGMAYAVGGPVGVATTTGAAVESTVEGVLSKFVEDRYSERFQRNLADGGLVVWVRVRERERAATASALLARHGGSHIHAVAAP
ncbi:MAG TPA: hypothetical protein VGB88_08720 [Alphaproteobacteria bacterium]